MDDKNMQKYEIYKTMHGKLKKALNAGFYYEAIFLEYAILEDRLRSVLTHSDIPFCDKNGREYKISKKIAKVKDRKEFQDKYIRKRIPYELLCSIKEWIGSRNALIHNLANIEYDNENLKELAMEGKDIVSRFSSGVRSVNNYFDKRKETNDEKK